MLKLFSSEDRGKRELETQKGSIEKVRRVFTQEMKLIFIVCILIATPFILPFLLELVFLWANDQQSKVEFVCVRRIRLYCLIDAKVVDGFLFFNEKVYVCLLPYAKPKSKENCECDQREVGNPVSFIDQWVSREPIRSVAWLPIVGCECLLPKVALFLTQYITFCSKHIIGKEKELIDFDSFFCRW